MTKKVVKKLSMREFQRRLGRVEELVTSLGSLPNPAVREQTRELIQTLLDLQGTGPKRTLETTYDSGADGSALINQPERDQEVSGLLLLHGPHPLDLEKRVRSREIATIERRLRDSWDRSPVCRKRRKIARDSFGCGSRSRPPSDTQSLVRQGGPDHRRSDNVIRR